MTLIDILKEANTDIHGPVLITLNGTFVAKMSYDTTVLKDGDEILAMRVVSGG
ncbi:MAG: MoaD/ThiS family protein [Firmicutes bacterium]|nr:MoaD/ThiS family protein [Bacillota bacterium]